MYNAVLILRSDAAVQGFRTHHFTIGSEIAVAAGPLGYGASAETGVKNRTPIYSYVLSRGFYAGVEMVGQVFLDRFDEVSGTLGRNCRLLCGRQSPELRGALLFRVRCWHPCRPPTRTSACTSESLLDQRLCVEIVRPY